MVLFALAFGLAQPPGVDLMDWTPRPATGKAEPWEKMKDPEWDDARFLLMDTGPAFHATMKYAVPGGAAYVYKASAARLGPGSAGGAVFDRSTMNLAASWGGGFLTHSPRRFALLNTPTPAGPLLHANPSGPGWAGPAGYLPPNGRATAPLPPEWAKYRGLYVHGDRVVWKYTVGAADVHDTCRLVNGTVSRTVHVGPTKVPLTLYADAARPVKFPASAAAQVVAVGYGPAPLSAKPEDILGLTKPGPKRWGEPLTTKLVPGSDAGPWAVDTLTVPYENPFKALFFCTGLDFLPDGRVALCTCHGDVWLVSVAGETCTWQRYATGLYHPLGLKVVAGKVVVLERGQLTRLHDENADGEADFYECVNNDWHTGGGEHSYDTCLETDPQGNFYFFKTGDTETPTGGCLMRVSADGAKSEILATGFRHPIGMGMSPTGIVTGADQEGNWMPATRVDQYRPGGFYGDMRAHHRATPPLTYDPPLCWLPREVDNSAGGQVWVPEKTFGALAGLPLHLSYGRCKAFVLLRQEIDGVVQGGVVDTGMRFLSGSCRGRFAADGSLYVCGLNGWQTAAKADGSLQRVRATGKPLHVPVAVNARADGFEITFSRELDRKLAAEPLNYRLARWNYVWSKDYGSYRFSVKDPKRIGQDDAAITAAVVSADGKSVKLTIPDMRPSMQVQVGYNVAAADGARVTGSYFGTVHRTK